MHLIKYNVKVLFIAHEIIHLGHAKGCFSFSESSFTSTELYGKGFSLYWKLNVVIARHLYCVPFPVEVTALSTQ